MGTDLIITIVSQYVARDVLEKIIADVNKREDLMVRIKNLQNMCDHLYCDLSNRCFFCDMKRR